MLGSGDFQGVLWRRWRPGRGRLGGNGWVCLILVVILVGLTLVRLGQGGVGGWGLPAGGLVMLTGLVWGAAVAGASVLPVWGWGMASLWLGWYGVTLMGPWAGTPLTAGPVVWLLGVTLARLAWAGPRWKTGGAAVWTLLCLGSGYLLAGPVGLNGWLGWTGQKAWMGQGLLAAALTGAGVWGRAGLRHWAWTEPGWGKVLWGSWGVMAAGLGLSAWRDFPAAAGWAAGVVDSLGGWAALGWFWIAGAFAAGLVQSLEWGTRHAVRNLPAGVERWTFGLIWLLVTAGEWLTTHPGAEMFRAWLPLTLQRWISSLPPEVRMVAWAHGWAGIVVLVLGAGFLRRDREDGRILRKLNALWIAAGVGILAAGGDLPGPEEGPRSVSTASAWGPALILGAGMLWILSRLLKNDRAGGGLASDFPGSAGSSSIRPPEATPAVSLAVLAALTGILWGVEMESPVGWKDRAGEGVLLGMVHLALPLMLHFWWRRGRTSREDLPVSILAGLIPAGAWSVLPLLHRDPLDSAQLAVCPVLWLGWLLVLRWRRPGLDASSGALAGALLASSTVAAWSRPAVLLPEVPLFSWLNPPAVSAGAEAAAARPFMDPAHFSLLLILGAVGTLLGWMVFRGREGPGVPMIPLLVEPVRAVLPGEAVP